MRLMDTVGRVARGIGVGLLIYPPNEFKPRSQVPGTVLFRARSESKVIQDTLH